MQARRPSQFAHRLWLSAPQYLDEKARRPVDRLGASGSRLTVLIHIVHTVSHIANGKPVSSVRQRINSLASTRL